MLSTPELCTVEFITTLRVPTLRWLMHPKISFNSFLFALNCWIIITSWEYRLFPANNWVTGGDYLLYLLSAVEISLMCAKVSVIMNRLNNISAYFDNCSRLGGGYTDRWKEAVTPVHQEHLESNSFVTGIGRARGDRCLSLLDSAGSHLWRWIVLNIMLLLIEFCSL